MKIAGSCTFACFLPAGKIPGDTSEVAETERVRKPVRRIARTLIRDVSSLLMLPTVDAVDGLVVEGAGMAVRCTVRTMVLQRDGI